MDGSSATHIPDFELPASTGHDLSLGSFTGKVPLVIVFLAGLESDRDLLAILNDAFPEFGRDRAQLLAVAAVSPRELRRYVEDNGIVMPVLADEDRAMFHDYGAEDGTGRPRRLAVVATAEGRMVARLDELDESDIVERLHTETRDLHLGADIEPMAGEG